MKKKKVQFGSLKIGQKFRYERKLYLKDDIGCPVRISDGHFIRQEEMSGDTLVTPVKIEIRVKG